MTATGQNLTMHRGDTKIFSVVNYDDDGSLLDLSGTTINYVIYRLSNGEVVVTKTTSSGVVLTNPLAGVLTITLNPADTEPLLGYFAHECELTDILGEVSTLFTGKVTILDSKA